MNSMQRQIAKARGKGGSDNAKVSVLLNDFEDADKMLAKVSPCPISFKVHGGGALLTNALFTTRLSKLPSPGAIPGSPFSTSSSEQSLYSRNYMTPLLVPATVMATNLF